MKSFHRAAATTLVAAVAALFSASASATCVLFPSAPESTVTPEAGGRYSYSYSETGYSGSCVNFHPAGTYVIQALELPYFTDAGITDIVAPAGWTSQIVNIDTFDLGHGAETLVWTAGTGNGIQAGDGFYTLPETLAGFGYTANYASAYSPGGLEVEGGYVDIVDPALPASPSALQAGLPLASFPPASAVPEPSSLFAMLAGLTGLALVRRRRN